MEYIRTPHCANAARQSNHTAGTHPYACCIGDLSARQYLERHSEHQGILEAHCELALEAAQYYTELLQSIARLILGSLLKENDTPLSGYVSVIATLFGTPTSSSMMFGSPVMTVRDEKSTRLPMRLPRKRPSLPFSRERIAFTGLPDFCMA